MDIVVAALVVLASAIAAVTVRRLSGDQRYLGLPSGELPPPGGSAAVERCGPAVAPEQDRPLPPDELSPGLTGLVLDGRADPIEIAATLVDLAVQGRLTITEFSAPEGSRMTSDWLFARTQADPAATQTPPEAAGEASAEAEPAVRALPSPEGKLMELLFAGGDQVRLSELTLSQRRQLNEVADLLLAEAEQRHWFRRLTPLADAGLRLAGPALFLAGAAVIGLLGRPWLGGGLILAGVIFWVLTQGLPNPPVTADGYALRVQALGFRRYLDGTERSGRGSESSADQVRYLPYAMVFGAVESWRERLAQAVGSSSPDGFGWLAPLAPDGRLLAADGALPRLVEDLNHHLVTARLISDTLAGAGSAVAGEPVAEGGSPLARFAQRNQP